VALTVPEQVSPSAPGLIGAQLLHQYWADVVFLHWPVAASDVAPLLPAGVRPDEHDATSWVGLVHFRMQRLGLGRLPRLPWLGDFTETNVRLYTVDNEGRRGVVFRCLDADRGLPVLVARTLAALPYNWAPSTVLKDGKTLTYESVRRWPGPRGVHSRTHITIGDAIAEPSPLEHFLTARWALHTSRLGPHGRHTVRWPNEHPIWPLHSAELVSLDEDMVAASGLPQASRQPPVSVLYSPGLPVRFGRWEQVLPGGEGAGAVSAVR
jgi:uncharacterized protein YqjF (DUF2071 family)